MPKIGLVISGNIPVDMSTVIKIARMCEQSNVIDGVWMGEVRCLDAGVALGVIATNTKRVSLGTSILNIYSRSPAQMAMLARSLQDISRGRFTLGIGASTPALVEGFHGVGFEKPLSRMREYVEIVRWFQSGDQTPAKPTRLFKPTTAKLIGKLPSPSSKVFVASLNPKMTKLAGEVGDGVIFNFLIPSAVERKLVPLMEGVKSSGRQLTSFEICTQLYIDHEYNEENLRRLVYFYSSSEAYRNHFASIGFEELASEMRKGWENDDKARVMRAITPEVIQELCVAGGESKLVERIYALEKSGIQNIVLAPNPYSDVEKNAGWAIQALSKKEYGNQMKNKRL